MPGTFVGADAFNQPLVWDTSEVTMMEATFTSAKAFNQPGISAGHLKVSTMTQMFDDSALASDECSKQEMYEAWSTSPPSARLVGAIWAGRHRRRPIVTLGPSPGTRRRPVRVRRRGLWQ